VIANASAQTRRSQNRYVLVCLEPRDSWMVLDGKGLRSDEKQRGMKREA